MKKISKVTARWSKKENDWVFKYPEMGNRNGRITAHFLNGMIARADSYCKESLKTKGLRDYFISGGFDPDTFTISINQIETKEN